MRKRYSGGSEDLKYTVAGGEVGLPATTASPAVKFQGEVPSFPEISGLMMGGITKGARKIPVFFYSPQVYRITLSKYSLVSIMIFGIYIVTDSNAGPHIY